MAQIPVSSPIQGGNGYVCIEDLPHSQVPAAYVKSPSSSFSLPTTNKISTDDTDFFRKVTGIICFQVSLTAIVVVTAIEDDSSEDFLVQHDWILIVAAVLALLSALLPMCLQPLAYRVPYNYLNLLLFVTSIQTLSFALMLAYLCLLIPSGLIYTAGILTLLVTFCLFVATLAV